MISTSAGPDAAVVVAPAPPVAVGSALDASRPTAMLKAVAWLGAAKTVAQVLSWVGTLMVARWLEPGDYGTVAMGAVFFGVVAMVAEFGIGARVITLPRIDRDTAGQLNTLSLFVGLAGLVVGVGAAPAVAAFYEAPRVAGVMMALSTTFIATSLKAVPDGLIQRDGQFRVIAGIEAVRALITITVTVLGAAAGWGYWSLIAGMIVGPFAAALMSVLSRPCSWRWPSSEVMRDTASFSRDILSSRLGWYWYENADFLIAGWLLGETAAGIYWIAWTLASIPIDKLGGVLTHVALPFFSAAQEDPDALRRHFCRITEALALLTLPACTGLALVAPEFVQVVLGSQWRAATVPLMLLCLYAPVRVLVMVQPALLLVVGQRRFVVWNTLLAAVLMPVGFVAGSTWGTAGIAAAWIVLYPVVAVGLWMRTLRSLEMTWRAAAGVIGHAATATIVMAGCVLLTRPLLAFAPPGVRLAILVLIGVATYLGVLVIAVPDRLRAATRLVREHGAAPATP